MKEELVFFERQWFLFFRVDMVIDKEGVWVRIFPSFRRRFKLTPWEQISEYVVQTGYCKLGISTKLTPRKIGTGIRMISCKTYNFSGRTVLQLTLKNNNIIHIGTKMPEELTVFLEKLDAERKQK